jgi:tetratricopeptide (TPR) repeat protein
LINISNEEKLSWLIRTREHLQSAIRLSPYNPDYEVADAAICYQLAFHDPLKSREWLERCVRISLDVGTQHPDKPHYYKQAIHGLGTLAESEFKAGKWTEACKFCEEAMKLIENHFRKSKDIADIHHYTLTTLDYYCQALGHLDKVKAIEVYDQYIAESLQIEKIEPQYQFYQIRRAGAYLGQAKLHHQLGDTVASKTALETAKQTLVTYKPVISSDADELAVILSRISEFEKE